MKKSISSLAFSVLCTMGLVTGFSSDTEAYVPPMADAAVSFYSAFPNGFERVDWSEEIVNFPKYYIFEEQGKQGLLNAQGQIVVEPLYDKINWAGKDHVIVKNGSKIGWTDLQGQEIVPPEYDSIKTISPELFYVKNGRKSGIINRNNQVIIPVEYKSAGLYDKYFIVSNNKDKVGVFDLSGHEVLPCLYKEVHYDAKNTVFLVKNDKTYSYLSEVGTPINSVQYKSAVPFSDGLAAVCEKDVFGYIDINGKYVIEPQYKFADHFRNGKAYVINKDNTASFIDTSGNEVASAPLGRIEYAKNDGNYIMHIDKTYALVDSNGSILNTVEGNEIFADNNGGYRVVKKDKYTFLDENFKVLNTVEADQCQPLDNGLFEIIRIKSGFSLGGFLSSAVAFGLGGYISPQDGNWMRSTAKRGYLNADGMEIISSKNDYNSNFYNGRVLVMVDDKFGYADKTGSYLIAPEFDDISTFGLYDRDSVVVKKNDKYGLYDINKGMIADNFADAQNFVNGLAPVCIGADKWGYIDKTGTRVIRAKFDWVTPFYDEHATVKINGKYRIIDRNGDTVAELPNVEEATAILGGSALVKINGKWGIIDINGKILAEPVYRDLKVFQDVTSMVGNVKE